MCKRFSFHVSDSFYSIRPVSFHIIQKNVNLATSLYFGAESDLIAAQIFFIVADSQMRFGTNYNDTLNLLYMELLRFSVKFGKHWSGPNFEVRLGLLF